MTSSSLKKVLVLAKYHMKLPTPFMVLRLGTTEIFLLHGKKIQAFAPVLSKSWQKV
jgi:hypothetical protein